MKHTKFRKELILALIFSIFYLLLNIFQYHIEKLLLGASINIIRTVFFSLLLILFTVQLFKIISRRKKTGTRGRLKFIFYLPAMILAFALLYTFSPVKISSEKLESPVILKGCYESGTGQAFIRFRANKNFEIKWKNESDNEWFSGVYKQDKDTFFLTYFDKSPDKFGSIILNTGQLLKNLDRPHTQENYYISFYLGNCK